MNVPAAPSHGDPPGGALLARVGRWSGPLFFVALLFWDIPGLAPIEQRAAAVTVFTAIWWLTEAVPIGVASLLPAVLLPLCGVVDSREVATAYMNHLILLFLGAFLLALGLERWNVHRRVALQIASRVGGRPRRLVFGFMVAAAFLSMWLNNTATTLMMLPICVALVDAVCGKSSDSEQSNRGDGPEAAFGIALLLGVAYGASVGGVATPVGTAPNQVFLGLVADSFPERPAFSFAQWTFAFTPLVILFVPLASFLLTRVLLRVPRDGQAGAEVLTRALRDLGPWRRPERRMAVLFGITALLWVTQADLRIGAITIPGWEPVIRRLGAAELSAATVALAMAIVGFLVPAGGGERGALLDWNLTKRMPWEVLLLLGGGFALALGFRSSGLDARLGEALGPLLAGLSPWAVTLVIALAVSLLTEITSNTATTQVLLPVLASAGLAAGVDPYLWMLPATVAASCAFMLPVATPPNAVVFSSGRVPIARMARIGVALNLLAVLLITLVFQLVGRPILGI